MNIIWKIRYFDRNERTYKDRCLYVDTSTLEVAEQHALELIVERRSLGHERDIIAFRTHFGELTDEDWKKKNGSPFGSFSVFSVMDYIEDELGNEIPPEVFGPLITGNPNTVLIPAGADQADINLMFGPSIPYDLDSTILSNEELRVVAYFVRDIKSLASTALVKEGPGTLHAGPHYKIETAVSHEEIRACVAIFRTLYMENEPANLKKAASVFVAATQGNPISRWVAAKIDSYQTKLKSPAGCMVPEFQSTIAFTTKRIIDVFLYTQFAHQPDERRQRQYGECLTQMNDQRDALMWLFLTELQNCYLQMLTVGNVVCRWFDAYCRQSGMAVDYLKSITDSHEGIGKLEKRDDASRRVYEDRVQAIAEKLWQNAGKPAGGAPLFRQDAKVKLDELLERRDSQATSKHEVHDLVDSEDA